MAEDYRKDPDVVLMLKVCKGDRQAFEELVQKYQKAVINTVYRYIGNPSVAEDLAQDVFLRVYRAAQNYKPDARFSTWLFTIVRNLCANYRSRVGKYEQKMDSEADPVTVIDERESPEALTLRKEMQEKIQEAINDLPDSLKLPLILHQFNQMQYEEVAKTLDLSLTAVKVRIHRARLALAEKLKAYVDDEDAV